MDSSACVFCRRNHEARSVCPYYRCYYSYTLQSDLLVDYHNFVNRYRSRTAAARRVVFRAVPSLATCARTGEPVLPAPERRLARLLLHQRARLRRAAAAAPTAGVAAVDDDEADEADADTRTRLALAEANCKAQTDAAIQRGCLDFSYYISHASSKSWHHNTALAGRAVRDGVLIGSYNGPERPYAVRGENKCVADLSWFADAPTAMMASRMLT